MMSFQRRLLNSTVSYNAFPMKYSSSCFQERIVRQHCSYHRIGSRLFGTDRTTIPNQIADFRSGNKTAGIGLHNVVDRTF